MSMQEQASPTAIRDVILTSPHGGRFEELFSQRRRSYERGRPSRPLRGASRQGGGSDSAKPAACEHASVAADDEGFKLPRLPREDTRGGRPRAVGDERGPVEARGLSKFERGTA